MTPTPQPTPQERYEQALQALNPKQRVFVQQYLVTLNATEAARRAQYAAPNTQGPRLLVNVRVWAAVQAGFDLQAMPEPEILARLSRIARGTIADVLRLPSPDDESPDARGDSQSAAAIDEWAIDLHKAQRTGGIHLVKKIKQGEHGPEVELYSAHEALRDLAKIRGMTIDRKEISGPGGGAIPVQAFLAALTTAYADDDNPESTDTP